MLIRLHLPGHEEVRIPSCSPRTQSPLASSSSAVSEPLSSRAVIRFLFQSSRRGVVVAALLGGLSGACSTALLALIREALQPGAPLGKMALAFAGLCLVLLASRIASQTLVVRLGQDAVFRLRLRVARGIAAAPLRRLEEVGRHRLFAALTEDVTAVAEALPGVGALFTDLCIVFGCLLYLAWLSPVLLGAVFAVALLGIVSHQAVVRVAFSSIVEARRAQDEQVRHLLSLVEGVKELKLFQPRRDAFVNGALQDVASTYRRHLLRGMTLLVAGAAWGHTLFLLAVGTLLFIVPRWGTFPPDVLAGFVLGILYMSTPLEFTVTFLPQLGRARACLQNVQALGLLLAETPEPERAPASRPSWSRLELRGITHAYQREQDGRDFVLGPLDLTLRPGELVMLVGGNGSGKTTLAKILTGLYEPQGGEVLLDGEPMKGESRAVHRQLFSAVFADSHLFDRLYGLEAPEERTQALLQRLELDHKVRITAGTLSTTALSQGQRRRLMLLTALLEDRPFYVFDEWAADQDPTFREIFYREVLPELRNRGKGLLVISHDDKYFPLADRLLRLDYGQLSETSGGSEPAAPVRGARLG